MHSKIHLFFLLYVCACDPRGNTKTKHIEPTRKGTSLIILGNVQDGGSPHIGCRKKCCENLFFHPDTERKVVSLGIVDPVNEKNFLFEASPDIASQLKILKRHSGFSMKETPDAIFLTHAHIGHYSGLMYLGREAMNANKVTVYAMPRMKYFLENNGPWSQLVTLNNIALQSFGTDPYLQIGNSLKVAPLLVPHRDEYSETVGYMIFGPNKKALFIPDIDKWEKWDRDIIQCIEAVDYAFIDGTFYDASEINNRDISEIPHPFIIESMEKFKNLSVKEKNKIYFIHFNHTNPLLDPESEATKTVLKNGFHIARLGMVFTL